MMPAGNHVSIFCLLLSLPALAGETALVVDRGLPRANLNNVSGEGRSNVRWSGGEDGFLGDDFMIGAAGEKWVIDAIRTWTVPGISQTGTEGLGDRFEDVRLYVGWAGQGLTPVAAGMLAPGSTGTDNANIRISEIGRDGMLPYDDFGTDLRIFQVEFQRLNLAVEGGAKIRFGVWGMGRPIPGREGKTYKWFNHASNAPLSAARQDGADGLMLRFDAAGKSGDAFNCQGAGWDKPADINVQVLAHRVDAAPQP